MPLWDDTKLQALRLAAEMIMTQDLDMVELCESMDLEMEDLKALMDRVLEEWETHKLQVSPLDDDPPEIQLTFEEADEMEERRKEFERQNENSD